MNCNKKTIEYVEICPLCKTSYNQVTTTKIIPDWNGHNPDRYESYDKYDKCPYCHGDVIEAAEILKKRNKYLEKQYKEDVKEFNSYNLYDVFYAFAGKAFKNKSKKDYKNGYYFYHKDGIRVVYLRKIDKPKLTEDIEKNKKIMKDFQKLYNCDNLNTLNFNKKRIKERVIDDLKKDKYEVPLYKLLTCLSDDGVPDNDTRASFLEECMNEYF